jgi:indolepyruvate ferredoxin oxidoreductase
LQRELREIPGVTILLYAQTCATEKRRRRKRGELEDPNTFVVINDLVCEGCGDCSVESNCLSVIPKETPFGRKRQIDQNNCNKDYSCVNGFCPSFVTVESRARRSKSGVDTEPVVDALPSPNFSAIDDCYDLLVTGVGGTGVITVGALVTMAAHLEGKGASVLDFMGFAQKFGPVLSYIRIAHNPDAINQVRIEEARADALIGCDLVVSSSSNASKTYSRDHTQAAVNTAEMATADFVKHRDANLRSDDRLAAIRDHVHCMTAVDANSLASRLLGDTIYANVLLLGYAWQQGLVPVSVAALLRAIELNGVQIEANKRAFDWGRIAAAAPDTINSLIPDEPGEQRIDESLDAIVLRRADFLVAYQNDTLAERYTTLVDEVLQKSRDIDGNQALARAVARSYFKLLAYKDEYEVARLHTQTGFLESIRSDFGKDAKVRFHLAPPILNRKRDARGRPLKKSFGRWMIPAFRVIAGLRGLRGTAFDVFGWTKERRMERALAVEFEQTVREQLDEINATTISDITEVVEMYMDIRGYGPVKDEAVRDVRRRVGDRLDSMRRCAHGQV